MSQLVKIEIEKLIHGGAGLGIVSGKKIFVPFSAPGDVLDIKITADHGGWAEGKIVKIIHPSDCRVEPKCPVFGSCGGCQWQHISYDAQLLGKKNILCETLERIGKLPSPCVFETLPSPQEWHYRNRIQLHVDSKGRVGFYRARSKEIVEFESCAIADKHINRELAQHRLEFAKRGKGVSLHVEEKEGSFAQVNTAQNGQLKPKLLEWLCERPHETVLELYAGSGNFTFAIAKIAKHIVASDIDKRAIEAAKQRQLCNGICNIEFAYSSAARSVLKFGERCDVVLVDPPRKGCVDVVGDIAKLKPQTILYISCDPATLARDAVFLVENGYCLKKSLPIDMFPQTFHIESLTMFVAD